MFSNQERTIKELLEIKGQLEKTIDEKQKVIEALKNEIMQMKNSIAKITGLISEQSYFTADEIYESELNIESQTSKLPKDANYSRKIFDSKNVLICTIIYKDGDIVVSFPDPKEKRLTFVNYITKFVASLKPLKDKEPNMILDVKKVTVDSIDVVKEIHMKNLQEYDTIEFIERELKKVL